MTQPWLTPHIGFPDITFAMLHADLAREIETRIALCREWVTKGKMTQANLDARIAKLEAVAEDARRFETVFAPIADGKPMIRLLDIPKRHAVAWADRRAAVLEALELRARLNPQWIAKGRLTEADAETSQRCLQCMLALYEEGHDASREEWLAADISAVPRADR